MQDALLARDDLQAHVRLISFSFDPDYDTPQVMARYASYFKAPGFDWQFVTTADRSALDPILAHYGQWVIRDYDAQGHYLGTISHLLRVYVIDRDKRIRNIYSMSFLHADTVINDLRSLLLEAPPDAGS